MIDWVSANLPEIVAALLVWNGILAMLFFSSSWPSVEWVSEIASQVNAFQRAVVIDLQNADAAFKERDKKAEEIKHAITELKQVQQRCDPNNARMLRLLAYCYYEVTPRDTASGFRAIEKLFQILPMDARVPQDYEYYGKLFIATNRDSLGIIQLRKAFAMEPGRTDLLSEIANAWFKLKNYQEVITTYNEKIASGKDVRVTDYFYLGQAYYYSRLFNNADSVFMKLNDISPKFARGFYWRAKVNTQLDTTSELGLAKPFYEFFDSLIVGDSINLPKNQPQLIESYSYLAYYYILKKDKQKALEYLKKKLDLPLDPEDKKRVNDAIDQLEGRPLRK